VAFPLACLETPTGCEEQSVQIGSPIAAENMDGPAPAPDGSSMLFSADYNGILRLQSDGAVEQLTPAGVRAFAPALSPDGRRVLYQVYTIVGRYELWAFSFAGGEAIRLAEGVGGKWSPDGSAILYRTPGAGQLMWLSLQNGETHRVAPEMDRIGSFDWSPDGRRVAFSHYDGSHFNLYVAEVAGGSPRPLAPELAGVGQVAWSPDGMRLAFTNNATNTTPPEVYIINVDGSGLTNLTNTPVEADDFPGWLDNGRVAYIRNSRDLWVMSLNSLAAAALTQLPDMEQVIAFAVTAGQRP
jgi:Tol biopolymer transport system component